MRTLFIKLGAIGDVVQAAVAMKEFRRRYPTEEIDWVAGQQTGDLVRAFDVADHVIVVDDRSLYVSSLVTRFCGLLRSIWTMASHIPYDRMIVAYSDPKYRYLGLGVRAKRCVSFEHRAGRASLIQHRSRVHEYWRLLSGGDAEPIDVAAVTQSLGSHLLSRVGPAKHLLPAQSVVVAPGGARNLVRDDFLRRWPIAQFRALVDRLLAEGRSVVLVGAPSDAWVEQELGSLPVLSLIGQTSLLELISVLDSADVVVGNDSGILHLAALTSAGLVGLFGPTPANAITPLGRERTVALQEGNRISCSPCYDGKGFAPCLAPRCLEALSVERVFEAIVSVSRIAA